MPSPGSKTGKHLSSIDKGAFAKGSSCRIATTDTGTVSFKWPRDPLGSLVASDRLDILY
jgi:hypothetical protein